MLHSVPARRSVVLHSMAAVGTGLATGTRYGDSRFDQAPKWVFGSETRPMVGTSKTYMGAELAKQNDSPIGGLSPGPMYKPSIGPRSGIPGHEPPKYTFGEKRVILSGSNIGPGPGNIPFVALGKQRINSSSESAPAFGVGSATRDNMDSVHLSKHHVANLPSRMLLGGPIDYSRAADAKPKAVAEAAPSRAGLARALAVAMSTSANESDPKLNAALALVHQRVAVLHANGQTR